MSAKMLAIPAASLLHWDWEEGQAAILYYWIRGTSTNPATFALLILLEEGRRVGVVSPVPAGKYIAKVIKTTEGTELHRESGTRQKPLCSSVSSVVSQPSVQLILAKNPCWHPAAPLHLRLSALICGSF